MIPSYFVPLDALPRTLNGKTKRSALPQPEISAEHAEHEIVPPRTPVEAILSEVWKSVLDIERVSMDADFFSLGGHSLLATRLLARVRREMNAVISIREFFQSPTIAGMAEAISRSSALDTQEPPNAITPIARTRVRLA